MSSPEKVKEEQAACRTAVAILNTTSMDVKRALSVLYDHASGYAGEVEAVKEAIDNAVKVLSGKPVA
jgi:hypothetical protein